MQISTQQAFVEVHFFQAPQLFPALSQKPAVAYPKGRRAFNRITCGNTQQLYALSFQNGCCQAAWQIRGWQENKLSSVGVKGEFKEQISISYQNTKKNNN